MKTIEIPEGFDAWCTQCECPYAKVNGHVEAGGLTYCSNLCHAKHQGNEENPYLKDLLTDDQIVNAKIYEAFRRGIEAM